MEQLKRRLIFADVWDVIEMPVREQEHLRLDSP